MSGIVQVLHWIARPVSKVITIDGHTNKHGDVGQLFVSGALFPDPG